MVRVGILVLLLVLRVIHLRLDMMFAVDFDVTFYPILQVYRRPLRPLTK